MAALSSIADLEAVLRAPKRLDGTLVWRPQHAGKGPRRRNERINVIASVRLDGVTLEGVRFLAAASVFEAERRVSMQLAIYYGGKYRPFTRVDWRDTPHTNRKNPTSPLWMKSLGETHIHRLADNAFLGWPGIVASTEDLPEADATPPLEDFRNLVSYVSEEFALENADTIQEPPWEPWLIQS